MTASEEDQPSKRKAWTYKPPSAPPFADFMAGGDRRRGFLKYWVHDNISNAGDIAFFFGMKCLPAVVCSNFGARIARHLLLDKPTKTAARVRANLRRLHPDKNDAQIEAMTEAFAQSHGRQMVEYSVMQRMARNKKRVKLVGTEGLKERCAEGPVIFVGMHISNWEVLWQSLVDFGIPMSAIYDPPKERGRHWIAKYVRKLGGIETFPPGRTAVRPALRLLENGGNLLAYCDEGFEGRVRAPFFGSKPHLEGNYAFVARLARKTNALIVPIYITRDPPVNFTVHVMDPFRLPDVAERSESVLDDVILLNSVIEPIIKANAPEWYFITHTIPDA